MYAELTIRMVVLERMVERLMTDSPPSYPLFLFFSRIYVYAWSGYFFFFFFFRADVESPKNPLMASYGRLGTKQSSTTPPLLLINLRIFPLDFSTGKCRQCTPGVTLEDMSSDPTGVDPRRKCGK